jgi:hypothetical protein
MIWVEGYDRFTSKVVITQPFTAREMIKPCPSFLFGRINAAWAMLLLDAQTRMPLFVDALPS